MKKLFVLDFESPVIKTYSIESTIAEKFDAMLQRFELTSRMKDFYDIYYLASTFNFEGAKLRSAIFETLSCRGTGYESDSFDRLMSLSSDDDIVKRWKIFLKVIKDDTLEFQVVMDMIKIFLSPVFEAIIREEELLLRWDCGNREWVEISTEEG